jgi:PAS domain S-box-containing protein
VADSLGSGLELGVCLLDPSGCVLELDDEFALLTRLRRDDVVGRSLLELLPSAPKPTPHTPTHARWPDGEDLIELSCRPSSTPPITHVVLARRISSNLALASRIQFARQTLESIIEASPLAVATLDWNRRVVMWNRAAERIFGWSREEVLGQPYPLVAEHEREKFERLFEQVVMRGDGYAGIESVRQRKDGSPVEVRMHAAPLHDADGRTIGGMALLEDLTHTRALEERIRHSQKMEAVGRLAGGIAHDFNNLLMVIRGAGDLLQYEPSLSKQAHEQVRDLLQATDSARELIAQLMTFSRRTVVTPKTFDLNERLHDSAKMLARLGGETVTLALELDDVRAWVSLDPSQLDQVLLNLAVNAADAMPHGGTLSYATHVVNLPAGRAEPLVPGRYVCLEVRDTGVGIPPELLDKIFDPFFTTKPVGKGTGLGLANVYGIVRQARGDVEVESTVGHGTCFRLFLPLAQPPKSQQPSAPHQTGLPRGTERVLLVEDNTAVRKSMAKLLGSLGYQVSLAEDGRDALDQLEAGLTVELVLTDLTMPRIGGAELAALLAERAPTLPVVFMSGNLDVASLREQVERGQVRFLQKPVSLRDLATATRECLDARVRSA